MILSLEFRLLGLGAVQRPVRGVENMQLSAHQAFICFPLMLNSREQRGLPKTELTYVHALSRAAPEPKRLSITPTLIRSRSMSR